MAEGKSRIELLRIKAAKAREERESLKPAARVSAPPRKDPAPPPPPPPPPKDPTPPPKDPVQDPVQDLVQDPVQAPTGETGLGEVALEEFFRTNPGLIPPVVASGKLNAQRRRAVLEKEYARILGQPEYVDETLSARNDMTQQIREAYDREGVPLPDEYVASMGFAPGGWAVDLLPTKLRRKIVGAPAAFLNTPNKLQKLADSGALGVVGMALGRQLRNPEGPTPYPPETLVREPSTAEQSKSDWQGGLRDLSQVEKELEEVVTELEEIEAQKEAVRSDGEFGSDKSRPVVGGMTLKDLGRILEQGRPQTDRREARLEALLQDKPAHGFLGGDGSYQRERELRAALAAKKAERDILQEYQDAEAKGRLQKEYVPPMKVQERD